MSEVPRGTPASKVLTLEEIRLGLSDLAENGEGAQRTQAYRMLMSMSGTEAVLPAPMTVSDIVARLVRINRGAGQKLCRIAYVRAFPRRTSQSTILKEALNDGDVEIAGIDTTNLPRTLKKFYQRYPEIKRHGFPKGYPVGKGIPEQQAWIRKASVRIELDKVEARKAEAAMSLERARDGETEATEPDRDSRSA